MGRKKVKCPICDQKVEIVKKQNVFYYAKHGTNAGLVESKWRACILSEKVRH